MQKSLILLVSGLVLSVESASLMAAPAGSAGAGSAAADSTDGGQSFQLEEVLVTARKRVESLDRVPVVVTSISQTALQNNVATDLSKVGELAPQVSISQSGSGTGAIITVRGISSGSNDAGLDQSVAIEIDGVPISRGQVVSAALYDMKQIQVLEGPQALFFGKNSPAGVISMRTAEPTDHYEGYVTPGYEFNADERFIEGAVSGPLFDNLKARLAFRGSRMGGWIENVAAPLPDFVNPAFTDPGATQGNRLPAERRYSGRLTLLWTPLESFDAEIKWTRNSQSQNGGNATTEPFCFNGTTSPTLLAGLPLPGADCSKNQVVAVGAPAPQYAVNFPYGNGGTPRFESDFTLASLNLNWRLNKVSLASTTGYYDQAVTNTTASDWSPYSSIWFAGREGYTLYTQELRANTEFDGPVNAMVGAYYEHFRRPLFSAPDLFHTFNPLADNYTATNMQSYSSGSYYSGFAQVRWNIIPELELAAGARYSHDEKTSTIVNTDNGPAFPTLYPDGVPLRSDYADHNVSPEVSLTWHPTEDQTLYAAYKTGYKAGGISNGYLVYNTATPANIQFRPEKTRGSEVGYKATFLERRLRTELTLYRYTYDDLQVASYDASTISFAINNAASALIWGAEGQLEWAATRALTFHGNFGYNEARYKQYANAQCYEGQAAAQGCIAGAQDLTGKPLLRAPNLTLTAGGEYKIELAPRWEATAAVSGTHYSTFQTAADYSPGGTQDAFWLLDASLRVSYDNRFDLAFIGRDLNNAYYTLNTNGWSGSSNPNQYVGFFNRPREMVLQATARF
jgi:iron complex outermembrane receptor protein